MHSCAHKAPSHSTQTLTPGLSSPSSLGQRFSGRGGWQPQDTAFLAGEAGPGHLLVWQSVVREETPEFGGIGKLGGLLLMLTWGGLGSLLPLLLHGALQPELREAQVTKGIPPLTSLSGSRLGDVTAAAQRPGVRSQERLPGSLVSADGLGPVEITHYNGQRFILRALGL